MITIIFKTLSPYAYTLLCVEIVLPVSTSLFSTASISYPISEKKDYQTSRSYKMPIDKAINELCDFLWMTHIKGITTFLSALQIA